MSCTSPSATSRYVTSAVWLSFSVIAGCALSKSINDSGDDWTSLASELCGVDLLISRWVKGPRSIRSRATSADENRSKGIRRKCHGTNPSSNATQRHNQHHQPQTNAWPTALLPAFFLELHNVSPSSNPSISGAALSPAMTTCRKAHFRLREGTQRRPSRDGNRQAAKPNPTMNRRLAGMVVINSPRAHTQYRTRGGHPNTAWSEANQRQATRPILSTASRRLAGEVGS